MYSMQFEDSKGELEVSKRELKVLSLEIIREVIKNMKILAIICRFL